VATDGNWRTELNDVLATLDQVFPGGIRGTYLHGSRSDNTALLESDVDLTIIVKDSALMGQVAQSVMNRRLGSGPKFDPHVDTVDLLNDPHYAVFAARVKYSGELLRGEDVTELLLEPDYAAFQEWHLSEARKGIAMLRDANQVDPPVQYPNQSLPFYGYTLVRKPAWYRPRTAEGTRELVAVSTTCATAWVVSQDRRWITSKAEALRAIREVDNGERADVVEGIHHLCRVKYGAAVPDDPDDRAELSSLCERFLAFENEILTMRSE
jgi:hypothetical protein